MKEIYFKYILVYLFDLVAQAAWIVALFMSLT